MRAESVKAGAEGEYDLITDIVQNETLVYDFSLNYFDAISTYDNECIVQNPSDLKIAAVVYKKDITGAVSAVNANVCKINQSSASIGLPTIDNKITSISYYTLDGRQTMHPEGIVIKLTRYADGASKIEKIVEKCF